MDMPLMLSNVRFRGFSGRFLQLLRWRRGFLHFLRLEKPPG